MLAKLSEYLDQSSQRRQVVRDEVDFITLSTLNGRIKDRVRVVDLSPLGFSVRSSASAIRGDRLRLLLPVVGDVEAQVAWALKGCMGGWFTRPIAHDSYALLLAAVKTGNAEWKAG